MSTPRIFTIFFYNSDFKYKFINIPLDRLINIYNKSRINEIFFIYTGGILNNLLILEMNIYILQYIYCVQYITNVVK